MFFIILQKVINQSFKEFLDYNYQGFTQEPTLDYLWVLGIKKDGEHYAYIIILNSFVISSQN